MSGPFSANLLPRQEVFEALSEKEILWLARRVH